MTFATDFGSTPPFIKGRKLDIARGQTFLLFVLSMPKLRRDGRPNADILSLFGQPIRRPAGRLAVASRPEAIFRVTANINRSGTGAAVETYVDPHTQIYMY